jgi:hypothetical protein
VLKRHSTHLNDEEEDDDEDEDSICGRASVEKKPLQEPRKSV